MKKIGIFGGSFDPVHLMHVKVAQAAEKQGGLSQILVMPSFLTPGKPHPQFPGEDRLEMLKIAFDDCPWSEVVDYEIVREEISYTADSLKLVKTLYPDDEIWLIIGSDNLKYVNKWKDWQYISENASFLVYPRHGVRQAVSFDRIVWMNEIEEQISSSSIRNWIQNTTGSELLDEKSCLEHGLNPRVAAYIHENLT